MTTATLTAQQDGVTAFQERLAGKYLTFNLAGETFGIEILKVREIIGVMSITPVPNAPEHVRGVINLRGKIIPVMELRKRFHIETVADSDRTCIIVVEVAGEDGHRIDMGVLVDSVSEVLNIASNELEPPPALGADVDTSFLLGMAMSGEDVKILLDIDKIVLDKTGMLETAGIFEKEAAAS